MKPGSNTSQAALLPQQPLTVAGVPEGANGLVIADLARAHFARAGAAKRLLIVCRDAERMNALASTLRFFAPELPTLTFPAWDCLPFDRVSPIAEITARRMAALTRLVTEPDERFVVLTTVNAIVQRTPPKDFVAKASLRLKPNLNIAFDRVVAWLEENGYSRASTVRDAGDYAVRGGIIDLFAPGGIGAVRLDFFGDSIETMRVFDPQTQRSADTLPTLELIANSEFKLDAESISRFRKGYTALFGGNTRDDLLYEAVSAGHRYPGMEHWLPLFHDKLEMLFDYLPDAPVVFEPLSEEAVQERHAQVEDYYDARKEALDAGQLPLYKPLAPDRLYLTPKEWRKQIEEGAVARITPFGVPDSGRVFDPGIRAGRNFAPERTGQTESLFGAVVAHLAAKRGEGKHAVVATWSEGSRERLQQVLADHGLEKTVRIENWSEAERLGESATGFALLGLESGFETASTVIVAEQDILGDRLARPQRKQRRAQDFIAELTSLSAGDLVVHVDHGIGRFVGLKTIEALGTPHDCLEIHYADNNRLFLPVENLELLSRYGSEETGTELDRLGGAGWQNRKARLKQRIREMAAALVKVAAARSLHDAPRFTVPEGQYDEFCARFPYEETEDQDAAINAVIDDLGAGKPMDRLVCGDVGFGKTEVALRAAFLAASNGAQVAVVVPTTLLARQHFKTFSERFRGFPMRIGQASRLVSSADIAKTRAGLADGSIDIVIGTHALLAKSVEFKNLGLVIVDEEQHFGVAHKERLKELRTEVHVLTLTATPIPRTLQLALTGVRELSLIASPPVDRLAVRTFVSPFDPLIVREALLREKYRGGQAFYVCPRIEDLAGRKEFLDQHVPEIKAAVAHGQMPPTELERIMTDFYDGKFDVLLSTTIVESGLDIPTANTLLVHRADRFGLAQLYQLRGRVGRSKTRAYALLTIPADKPITPQAERRLKVLQSLDQLGAGFELASHDLDIRGAGNLLGDEQSGHIREVGYELYQEMLEEAVMMLKAGVDAPASDKWSPQINVGAPVMIPEEYVPDLAVRLGLYRRLAELDMGAEIDQIAAEIVDRFGPMPDEVKMLIEIVAIKALCRAANIAKFEAGAKGAVIAFRDNRFDNPDGLISWIAKEGSTARVRPDQSLVVLRGWDRMEPRLKGAKRLLESFVALAQQKKAA
ncbi:MAG: transcription-repair coupling factor [Xanthobacteraceae bacterium]|nr:transcription-repair coupling factor [Xanthobacteraceae bacterium]